MQTDTRITISNTCECEDEDGNSVDCGGMCWDDAVEEFTSMTESLFESSPTTFSVKGFPLWDGQHDGSVKASDAEKLLRSITVNGDWTLRYEVKDAVLYARLSHHDAPMGGEMTITPLEDSDEDY